MSRILFVVFLAGAALTVGARAQAPNGLRAEMLDDRKFYYDVNSKPSDRKPVRGRVANLWRPIGPDPSVAMARKLPYVGDHAPRVSLAIPARSPRMIGILPNVHSNSESV